MASPSMAALRAGLDEVRAQLADHPDVTMVGIGEKTRDGVSLKRNAIVIGVERKGAPTGAPLPTHISLPGIGEVDTDIIEAPVRSLVLANNRIDGGDLLVTTDLGRTGTLALVVTDTAGIQYGITNAHVVAQPETSAIGRQVVAVVGGRRLVLGAVSHMRPLSTRRMNAIDLALIRLDPAAAAIALPYAVQAFAGKVQKSAPLSAAPQAGSRLPHRYGSAVAGFMEVVVVRNPVEVPNQPFRDASGQTVVFRRVFSLTASAPGVRSGHSGALVVKDRAEGGLFSCGLVMGGEGPLVYAFSFTDVFREIRELGVEPV